jgi:hypothetical protein
MALIPLLEIVGTPAPDELIAAPTRPWTQRDDDNNVIDGLEGGDTIQAGGGDDRLDGGPDDDRLDGGSGSDTAVYSEPRGDYEVFRYDTAGGGREAVVREPDGAADLLLAVEYLEFPTASGAPDRAPLTDFAAFPALNYAASHPDLASTIGVDQGRAWAHFRDFGAAEGRGVTFDGLQYVAGQDDLAAAFAPLGDAGAIADAGAAHFIRQGRAEGREEDAFDEDQYLANYPDLGAAGLDTPEELALHYVAQGRAEGRTDEALIA